jgi:voltage-gated potassium channel
VQAGPVVTGSGEHNQHDDGNPPALTGPGRARQRYDDLSAATRRWMVFWAVARPSLIIIGLLLMYYLMPLWDRQSRSTGVLLVLGLLLVAVLLAWQIRMISTSKYPRVRAIEALSLSAPLFVFVFATAYFATAQGNPGSFSQPLNRTDALYFAVTTFSSVGFGDIVPVTQTARVMVMIQMVGDLIVVGIVVRVILGAVQSGLRRHQSET